MPVLSHFPERTLAIARTQLGILATANMADRAQLDPNLSTILTRSKKRKKEKKTPFMM